MLTDHELNAIRYYIGDTEGTDGFWGDEKAYVLMNALFFSGIRSETDRAREGKYLNTEILADPKRLYEVLTALMSACRKCALPAERETYRVERMSDFAEMQHKGKTVSFTSTSTDGFLSAYADRRGIALLHFILPEGTPCIPMAEVLPHYAKADEAEVLLPPGLPLHIREYPVPECCLAITDADGKPPVCFAKISVEPTFPEVTHHALPREETVLITRLCSALMLRETPSAEDIGRYIAWKQEFQQALGV